MKKKNAKAVVAVKPKKTALKTIEKELQWAGHEKLMIQPRSQQDIAQRQLIVNIAKIYNMPLLGITILANMPYINKDGLLYKAHEYFKIKSMRTEFIQYSKGPEESAIAKSTINTEEGIEVEGIGEASRASVKLDLVKNTLNMMAETRATNRAIRKLIAMKLWQDVEKRLNKEKLPQEIESKILDVGKSSYEEMDNQGEKNIKAPTKEDKIKEYALSAIDRCDDVDKLLNLINRIKKNKNYDQKIKDEIMLAANQKASILADMSAVNE